MLKPAICYKTEIEDALKEYFYTDDMMYYQGCLESHLLNIADKNREGHYQYAVVDASGNLIGYIAYMLDYYSSSAYSFGAFSFDRGNPIMGRELYAILEHLINSLHRVEFRAVSGNPATRGYDSFLKRHTDIGKKYVLRDVFKDANGNYHGSYIYEFVNT